MVSRIYAGYLETQINATKVYEAALAKNAKSESARIQMPNKAVGEEGGRNKVGKADGHPQETKSNGGLIPANHGALPVRCWSESLAQGGLLGAGVEAAELLTGEPACLGICNHLPHWTGQN